MKQHQGRDSNYKLKAYTKIEDDNTLDQPLLRWKTVEQKPREGMRNYATRFKRLTRALERQDYKLMDKQINKYFMSTIKERVKAQTHKQDTIDKAIAFLEPGEPSTTRTGTVNTVENTQRPKKEHFTDKKGNKRCSHCCRIGHTFSRCRQRSKRDGRSSRQPRVHNIDSKDTPVNDAPGDDEFYTFLH
mmetsp:Transcript_23673/g.35527  ORF Transcript_23673/g.35527 Transcript_23673/m.35527 type:complete len:188 (+) Transcript_23673:296-859(+)